MQAIAVFAWLLWLGTAKSTLWNRACRLEARMAWRCQKYFLESMEPAAVVQDPGVSSRILLIDGIVIYDAQGLCQTCCAEKPSCRQWKRMRGKVRCSAAKPALLDPQYDVLVISIQQDTLEDWRSTFAAYVACLCVYFKHMSSFLFGVNVLNHLFGDMTSRRITNA